MEYHILLPTLNISYAVGNFKYIRLKKIYSKLALFFMRYYQGIYDELHKPELGKDEPELLELYPDFDE